MKLSFAVLFLAAAVSAIDIQGCVETIPEGEDPANYNLCREHALGHDTPVPEVALARKARVQTPKEIADECGSLGVMEVPRGENATEYRKCRDHPLASKQSPEVVPKRSVGSTSPANTFERRRRADIEKRACWHGASFGCSDNWCWSICDHYTTGKWCWLAVNDGKGAWAKCSAANQCDPLQIRGLKCGGRCSC